MDPLVRQAVPIAAFGAVTIGLLVRNIVRLSRERREPVPWGRLVPFVAMLLGVLVLVFVLVYRR